MLVSCPQSRANDHAWAIVSSLGFGGQMWAYWGELEWTLYYAIYRACREYDLADIAERHRQEIANTGDC